MKTSTVIAAASSLVALVPAGHLARAGLDWWRRPGAPGGRLLGAGAGVVAAGALGTVVTNGGGRASRPALFATTALGWTSLLFCGWQVASRRHGVGEPETPVDYIVVLGAGLIGARVPPVLAARIETAVALRARMDPAPVLVMSGGKGDDEHVSEASAMAAHARAMGVPEDALWLEDRSTTTWENLVFSSELAHDRLGTQARGLVVSNDFHTLRAALMARAQGVQVGFCSAPTVGISESAAQLREFGALAYQWPLEAALAVLVVPAVVTAAVETR